MRNIETAIEIEADAPSVWAVLTHARERAWDPMFSALEGVLAPEQEFLLRLRKGPAMKMRVSELEPNRVLEWTSGIRGVFFSRHRFELLPRADQRTLLKHSDRFSGMVPSLLGRLLERVALQYGDFNRALKAEAEAEAVRGG